ncbi:MAG TPA: hypothetical protein VMW46_03685 [Candidatus Desulfaltia sp.]|nr:hypothetical protein [Candidatus Desulfaltia sp.]
MALNRKSLYKHIPEPAVRRQTLILSAAVVWALVGAFLSFRAVLWFRSSPRTVSWMVVLALVIGFLKGHFLLSKMARRNIKRILGLSPHKEKICLFAFQAIQAYLVIFGMMAIGIILRHSSVAREVLAIIYLAIGSGLMYASIPYWMAKSAQSRNPLR